MPKAARSGRTGETVPGIVIAGAAARGAYAAGALACLAPEIKKYDRVVIVGTSSGAVNAALLAQSAHLEKPAEIDASLTEAWAELDSRQVFGSVLSPLGHARRVAGRSGPAESPSPACWTRARCTGPRRSSTALTRWSGTCGTDIPRLSR
ncbi:patatin-like phospholipase family protein [Frankia sp. AgPm24]|uniref:patatin-like phospholipase family protein n=1 Tax=Frankia sp. AgPm24 TaxID=631128 RepID=UPI0035B2EF9D